MFFEIARLMHRHTILRTLFLTLTLVAVSGAMYAATVGQQASTSKKKVTRKKVRRARKAVAVKPARASTRRASRVRRVYRSPWTEPTYADSTNGDYGAGDDPVVRSAAVEALGPYNGTVVAVDPSNGRVLTIVNQRVALHSGFQPCSTIKIPVALAALSEGLIERTTPIRLARRTKMDLTYALAHSNNAYFANLGVKLGYERFAYYARQFGLGERAGLDIPGEEAGVFPDAPPQNGGMGMMTSFGEGIAWTPLELAALLSSVSNGGTLYYLQYPRTLQETMQFTPRVKRYLDISEYIPEIKPGMMGAVEYGTARRAVYDPEAPVCGKTGTCTGGTTHLGWFGSFSDFGQSKIVVVVLLTGGRGVSGPTAAQVTGAIYRKLQQDGYFGRKPMFSPAILVPR